jgi:hypothetical protein
MRLVSEFQANEVSRSANAVAEHSTINGADDGPFAQRLLALVALKRERRSDKRDCHLQSPYATTTKGLNA